MRDAVANRVGDAGWIANQVGDAGWVAKWDG